MLGVPMSSSPVFAGVRTTNSITTSRNCPSDRTPVMRVLSAYRGTSFPRESQQRSWQQGTPSIRGIVDITFVYSAWSGGDGQPCFVKCKAGVEGDFLWRSPIDICFGTGGTTLPRRCNALHPTPSMVHSNFRCGWSRRGNWHTIGLLELQGVMLIIQCLFFILEMPLGTTWTLGLARPPCF